jgi:hypothetical protein
MKYLLAAAALLASTIAPAAAVSGANDSLILPPAVYDKPFPGRVIENTAVDMDDMAGLCSPNPKAGIAMGCSIHFDDSLTGKPRACYVYFAPDWYLQRFSVTREAVRRHEIAHCNGWPQSHPR